MGVTSASATLPRQCQGLGPNQSLVGGVQARDLEVELDMVSLVGVDKGLILRSTGVGDQIELAFRAERPGAYPADFIVQEQASCNLVRYTEEFAIHIPHQVAQTIHVRVRLIGSQLTVWVDGAQVLDASFPFMNVGGQVHTHHGAPAFATARKLTCSRLLGVGYSRTVTAPKRAQ